MPWRRMTMEAMEELLFHLSVSMRQAASPQHFFNAVALGNIREALRKSSQSGRNYFSYELENVIKLYNAKPGCARRIIGLLNSNSAQHHDATAW
ncbi:hypothetical protein EJB05_34729 [Eragrostis curvula]|uniref:Uncharacterized protein n=1 Tax=Eragrostis curvula TaxID=38414 RepID=A0A5J9U4I6_9POAL|nr:hypothetical protein EJB05_34729 [Eragrostis curvula]